MSSTTISPRGPDYDLRSCASAAAVELDNIIIDREVKTKAISRLIEVLESGVPASGERGERMELKAMITPTVIVMDRVVRTSKPGAVLSEVIAEFESILGKLKYVAYHSDIKYLRSFEPDTLKELMDKCLVISRYAASLRRPPS